MEDGMNASGRHEAGAWSETPTIALTPTIAFPEPKEKCIFASMRFRNGNVLREATLLQRELGKRGYKLYIIDMKSGEDIDEKVFSTIEHCDTFLVFGTHDYGENTGNSASTYQESKYAMNKGKKIIPIWMIPFDQGFNHLQARVLFGTNLMFSKWIEGQPMPTNVVDEILNAIATTSENPSPTGTSAPNLSAGQGRPVFNAFQKASDKVRQAGKSAMETAKEGAHKVYAEIKPKTETKTSTEKTGILGYKRTTTETTSGLLSDTVTIKEETSNGFVKKTKTRTLQKEKPLVRGLGGALRVGFEGRWRNARVALDLAAIAAKIRSS